MKKHCPVCQTIINDVYPHHAYLKCPHCGSYCVKRMPDKTEIIEGLNAWATDLLDAPDSHADPNSPIYQRVNTLTRMNPGGKRLLDVGCGMAEFLKAAKQAGFHVSGTDISVTIRTYLKRLRIPSYVSLSEVPRRSCDVVTNFDVIEHTTDPQKFIHELQRILKPNGILMMSTPNAGSLSAKLLGESWWVFGPDGHYVLFTPNSLRNLLAQNGFSVIDIHTDTLTQWFHMKSPIINRIGNKIIFSILFPFLRTLFRSGLGDNIEVLAKKS